MPYQKIGTPVFWIDTLQYLESMGVGGPFLPIHDIFGLNPTSYPKYEPPTYHTNNHGYKWFKWGLGAPMIDSTTPSGLLEDHKRYENLDFNNINIGNLDYMAYLNHSLASSTYKQMTLVIYGWDAGDNIYNAYHPEFGQAKYTNYTNFFDDYINADGSGNKATRDGYSICTHDISDVNMFGVAASIKSYYNTEGGGNGFGSQENAEQFGYPRIGCISIGKRYQMPHSPDLNLTQTYDYGSKEIEAKQGASLSNNMWQNPKWGNLGAWELATVSEVEPFEVDQNAVNLASVARSGKKVYDLSFSYLDDGDVFGANQTLSRDDDAWQGIVTEDDYPDIDDNNVQDVDPESDKFNKNILNDQSFYTSVIHKTNGGALPFIFQPNSEDKTNMIIAKLDMKAFSFKQVANGVYNVRLKIREV